MTARKPAGYPCHIDPDLAHVAAIDLRRDTGVVRTSDLEPRPCSRRHAPVPVGAKPGPGLLPRTRVRLLPDPPKAKPAPSTRSMSAKAPNPPTDPPPATSRPARSTPKRPRKAGAPYTDEERRVALELVEAAGIAAAHGSTGIPKATLSRWAKAAGIELDEAARARTRAAGAAVEAKAAELKVTTVDRLERILDDQLATLEAIGKLERRAAEAALNPEDGRHALRVERSSIGRTVELDDDTAAGALALARLVTESITKRDVVGAATRAVHDLQLLKGDATERGAIVVRFGIPRSSATEADAAAIDEADLGASPP